MVTVSYGANGPDALEIAGRTIAQVRAAFKELFGLPGADEAPAQLNGEAAAETDVLEDGDDLQFIKATAQKG